MKELFDIYCTFIRVGALTFGGGYAMLPMLQKEVIEKKHWATEEEVVDYFAVGQCMPGAIAVNTATFVGQGIRGVPGGIAAALGVVTPSLLIIMGIAAFIQNFIDLPAVQHAFAGIRVAVCALIFQAILKMWKTGIRDAFGLIVFLAMILLAECTGISSMWLVVGGVLAGILAKCVLFREKKGGADR